MTNHLITQQLVDQHQTSAIADAERHRLVMGARRRTDAATTAIPEPGGEAFRSWASDLAHHVAERGLAVVERAVTDVCASACRRGLEATCVAVAADRTQPPVARERALGHILMTLASWSPTTAATASDVA